jgi:DDE superfamily endonuclease
MVVYNACTGLKRRLPKRDLNWKLRSTHSSTVSARMYGKEAMLAFRKFISYAKKSLAIAGIILCFTCQPAGTLSRELHLKMDSIASFLLKSSQLFYQKALRMIQLDSTLLDIPVLVDESHKIRFHESLKDITLASYADNNECMVKTRFNKEDIVMILDVLDLPVEVKVYHTGNAYFKFKSETLMLYMLRKMATGRTHQDLTTEFGGCPSRWSRGYRWLVYLIDAKFHPLIGPNGLRRWADQFPLFAETLRQYIQRDKERIDFRCNYVLTTTEKRYAEDEFNVFSFTDATVYEVCRPGSGPNSSGDAPSDRRDDWYIKQRAFYDGYHRGMEACVKILTVCFPNGLTAAIYGPTSGRNDDRTLFHLSQFDDYLMELCMEFHQGDLFCTYGDGIFAGNWYCLRTMHKETTGLPLLAWQEEENMNLKAARESIEWSYARAEMQWPLLTNKRNFKVDQDSARCFAEIRVMYLLTNFKVCADKGSTMTGTRGFQCPPLLEDVIMGTSVVLDRPGSRVSRTR